MVAKKKKRVLIISFFFPPKNDIGAIRIGKFAKYLPEFCWDPIVLTSEKKNIHYNTLPIEIEQSNIIELPFFSIAPGLYDSLKANEVYNDNFYLKTLNWKDLIYRCLRLAKPVYSLSIFQILINDPVGWYIYALRKKHEILTKEIDLIFSSYSPSTSHLIASKIQKETGLPWIADFRDLWSMNPYAKTIRPLNQIEKYIEKKVMKNSQLLITVSEGLAQQLSKLHSKQVEVIQNGFDEEDYAESTQLRSKFTITYTGNIYPDKRDPTLLFEAISELKKENKISSDLIEVRFFGGDSLRTLEASLIKYNIKDIVTIYQSIPFRESINKQKESAILLLLEWNHFLAKDVLTGKLFEYLGAKRPILALAYKGGAIGKLIHETGTGILLNDIIEIKDVLLRWLKEWYEDREIKSFWSPRPQLIKKYTRKEETKKLAYLFDQAIMNQKAYDG